MRSQNAPLMRCCVFWPLCGRVPSSCREKLARAKVNGDLARAQGGGGFVRALAPVTPPPPSLPHDSTADACPICCGAVRLPHELPCGHRFCTSCLTRWLHQSKAGSGPSCPLCRKPVPPAALSPAALAQAAVALGAEPDTARAAVAGAVAAAAAAEVAAARASLLWKYGEPPIHWLFERPEDLEAEETLLAAVPGGGEAPAAGAAEKA